MDNLDLEILSPSYYYDASARALIYRVKRDVGGHWYGTYMGPNRSGAKKSRTPKEKTEDQTNAEHYAVQALKDSRSRKDKRLRMVSEKVYRALLRDHEKEHDTNLREIAEKGAKAVISMYHKRWLRFCQKVSNYDWSYFVTVTYSDDKWTDEDAFRQSLNKCFSNLATRRGWKVAGRYERGEEGNRLHFHALILVPKGEMIGKLYTDYSYSTKRHQMEQTQLNDFFVKRFGRTEFRSLVGNLDELIRSARYIAKYMDKDPDEKVRYSRGIATEICLAISETNDAIMTYSGGDCIKAILLDGYVPKPYIDSYRAVTEKHLRENLRTSSDAELDDLAERLRRRVVAMQPMQA